MQNYYVFILSIIFLLLFQACQLGDQAASIVDSTTKSFKNGEEQQFMKVTINNLRVRSTPDLEGAVLERLKEKVLIEYQRDSTTFTTMVKMNGEEHHESWFKVLTEAGNVGWVYGGCIDFLTEAENRRIIALKNDAAEKKKANGGMMTSEDAGTVLQEAPKVDDFLIKRFRFYLSQIQPQQSNAFALATSYYESIFSANRDATADMAFADLMHFHQEIINYYKKVVNIKEYQFFRGEIERYGSPNMQHNTQTILLEQNGLTFGVNALGKIYLKENVDFMLRRFYRLVSTPFREYLDQYAIESEHPPFDGDEIMVSITELGAYVVYWDKFLTRYPYSPVNEMVAEKRKSYATVLLRGTLANAPFDSRSYALNEEFKHAYDVLSTQMGHSPFIKFIQDYRKLLEAEAYTRTMKIIALQDQILDKL